MADLLHTICFRVSTRTKEQLLYKVKKENRKLGDIVRIIVEQRLAVEDDGRGEDIEAQDDLH